MTYTRNVIQQHDFRPSDLNSLASIFGQCWQVSEDKGWHQYQSRGPGEVHPRDASITKRLMLCVSELVEAMEEIRNGRGVSEIYYGEDGDGLNAGKPEGFPIEVADAIIRIGDLCHHYGINITKALAVKQRYNQTRETRHGGKVL